MRLRALVLALVVAGLPVATATAARAAEEICVAVVVDYRELDRAPSATSRHCAKVPNRSTGYEILLARARALRRPQPRSENGLICAIDGLPERGCGESGNGGYRYWAYFHRTGDGSWVYSSRGATDYRVIDDPSRSDDDRPSEGWVWVNGGAEGSDRPAATPYDDICPPKARPSAAPPASRSSSPAPAASSAPAPSASPGARSSAPPDRSTALSAATRNPSPAAGRSSTPTIRGAADPAGAANRSGDATASAEATAAPVSPSPEVSLADDGGDTDGRSGLPTSTVAGLAVVAALGVATVVRRRRGNPE